MDDKPQLTSASVVSRIGNLVDAKIHDEVVALSIESGICYGLNRSASRIWELLSSPIEIDNLCATLIREYEVDETNCQRDVLDFLSELHREGLIIANKD
jgi:hypothetical protein